MQPQQEQQPPAKGITMQDLLNMPGLFLGLAALLVLISGAAMNYLEFALIGLLVMGGSALISMVKINMPVLYLLLPLTSTSAVCGLWIVILGLGLIARGASTWQTVLFTLAGFISLFAAALTLKAKK